MKRLLLASSIALMLLSSTAAFAAPRDGGHDDRGHSWNHARDHDHHDRGHEDRDWNGRDPHRWNDGHAHDPHYWNDRHDGWWGDRRYGHDNGWHRGYYRHAFRHGDRVPVVYLQPRYYVDDYWSYRLAPPPRGYRWIRPVDGRFILVAATTGLIAEVLGY